MSTYIKYAAFMLMAAMLLLLAGCSPAAVVASNPTPDVQVVQTEAARTVVAAFTQQAAAAVALAPTDTPSAAPTETALPEPTETLAATATNLPTETPLPLPTMTQTKIVLAPTIQKSDMALLLLRTPAEYTQFAKGETFDVIWTLKNIGKKAWTNDYYMRYFNGTQMHYNGDKRFVKSTVAPGEQTKFIVDMKAPNQAGTYTTSWVLMNDNGEIFYQFFITIEVLDR